MQVYNIKVSSGGINAGFRDSGETLLARYQ